MLLCLSDPLHQRVLDPAESDLESAPEYLKTLAAGQRVELHERELDLVEKVLEAALDDLRALAGGQLVDQDGDRRELVPGIGADAAVLAELVERVAAAGGVEQVAGDGGVEDEVLRDLGECL